MAASNKRFISCIGWSDTGKTGFIESCCLLLQAKKIKTAAIKCVHHESGFLVPGKDTSRFFNAGADTALTSETETVLAVKTAAGWDSDFLYRLFPDAAFIFIEGRIVSGALKLIFAGSAITEAELKKPLQDFDVLISSHEELCKEASKLGLDIFNPASPELFIHYILEEV